VGRTVSTHDHQDTATTLRESPKHADSTLVGMGADQDGTGSRQMAARRSATWVLVAICAGYFMVILDTMVVNVALPALSRDLHTTTTGLLWVVDAYSLAFAVGGPANHELPLDLHGRDDAHHSRATGPRHAVVFSTRLE